MKVLYARVSSIDQNLDRQLVNQNEFATVIEDKCSGSIPFFDRDGGKKIMKLIGKDAISSLSVVSIDRLGRDLRDIINTIYWFNQKKIPIHVIKQGLSTLDAGGKENSISKMVISILGIVGEMERNQIRERQHEGIAIAKLRGKYQGRKQGAVEEMEKFWKKPNYEKALKALKKGEKVHAVANELGLHPNTVYKIKKLGLPQPASG